MGIASQIARDGYAFLPRHFPSIDTASIVRTIGEPEIVGSHEAIQQLTPRATSDATPNTYSGAYGLGEFPLHTDLAHWYRPPRFLLLRSIVGKLSVPTYLLDSTQLRTHLSDAFLARAIMKPRRPLQGKISLLTLRQRIGSSWLFRWDERYIQPASDIGRAASLAVQTVAKSVDRLTVGLQQAGDTLLIDNWRMLHGRGVIGRDATNRIIERCYLRGIN